MATPVLLPIPLFVFGVYFIAMALNPQAHPSKSKMATTVFYLTVAATNFAVLLYTLYITYKL